MHFSEFFIRRPVATTLLTLFTTPVIYLAFDSLGKRLGGKGNRGRIIASEADGQ